MAGIFSDVSTDIQKLRQLKAEIENVKKSLKGIDVNVNVDIAKGMKAQLQSLMKQYDTLVKKVSEAEGKIIISTKRINDASEKIIKAQEQLSKAAGMNTQPSNGNADVSLNNMGTTSVRAQAKAYNELAEEIDSVMGTRSQNIKRMIDEQNAIRLINEEIKGLTKLQIGNSTLTSTQQKRLEQLNNSLLTHKAALSEVRQTLMNNVRLDNAATTSMNGLSQSLSRMRIAYRELTEEERNSPFGKELLASIQQADAKIKELDATIGNHQRNVGNYAKGYNGLNMSVQQIVRELPSAAMGLNTFFLAISNNLPILTDEIKRAKTANEELKTSGQSTIPIWKQLVTSLFSWQTALTTGIMLLVMYGDEIVDWVKGLFTAKDALENTRKAQEEFNAYISKLNEDWRNSVATTAGENIAAYQRLAREYNALGDNMNAKKKFITDNQDAFHELGFSVNGVTDAENLFVKNTDAVVNALVARAKAAAYEQEITDATQRYIKQTEYNNSTVSGGGYYKTIHAGQNWTSTGIVPEELRNLKKGVDYTTISSQTVVSFTLTAAGAARINAQRSREAADRLKKNNEEAKRQLDSVVSRATEGIRQQTDAEQAVYDSLGLKPYDKQSSKKGTDVKQTVDERKRVQEDLDKDLLMLQRQNQDDETALMQEGTEKKLREIDNDYKKRLDEINRQEAEFRKKNKEAGTSGLTDGLTRQQQDALQTARDNAAKEQQRRTNEVYLAEQKQLQDRLKAEKEANERYLKNYGTFMQKKQAITEEYTRKISETTTEGDKKILQEEMEKELSSLDLEKLKQGINWEMVFGDLDKVSKESLNKVKQQLNDFKNSDEYKNMAIDQKKVIDEALNNIQATLIDKGGLLADLPDQLNELAKAQEELAQAQEEYNEAIKNGTDKQKESAAKKLNDAQKKQQNAQTNIQKSTDKTVSNLVSLSNTITELGANSEMSLSQVENLAGNVVNIFTEAGSKIGEIVGAAFSILDAISTQGLDGFIENVFGNVFKAVGNVFETLTFGLIGNTESDPHLLEDIERLTLSNQDLINSLDNLAEKLEDSAVADATDIYEQQKKNIEDQIANTQEMMQRSAAAYSNGFLGIGGTHSSNKKIDEAMSAEDWKRVSEAAGVSVTSASDFWNLTSEQMYNVANEATDLYSKIKQYADDGYQNASQYMDDYIEYWKQLEELEDTYREKLTDTSFDTVRDEFKNSLLDMESDSEDFAENFEKMMQQAVVESMMSDNYAKRLKDWYKDFADSMTDGTLTGTEQSNLKAQWDEMVNEALAERDAIMQAMGWDSSSSEQQSASSRGFETMSQDTADELNGRFTALYESGLRIETAEQQQTVAITQLIGSISALTAQPSGMLNIADETRTILANSYLELQQIRENTEDSAKYLKDIQADIAEVKRNTSRL